MSPPYGPPKRPGGPGAPGPYGPAPQQPQGQPYGHGPHAHPHGQWPQHNPYVAPHHGHAAQGHHAPPRYLPAPDPDRGRRMVGLTLWVLGMIAGVLLNVSFTLAQIFLSRNPERTFSAILTGAV